MENNPYAPPASSIEGSPEVARAELEGGQDFRDLSGLASKLSILLLIGVGLSILGIASSLMQLKLLSHAPYSMAEANANDMRERLIRIAHLLVSLVVLVMFLRWIYLAQRNLPALGARHMRFRPGWAVGSFFVPIVNLWVPFQAMRDLAKASRSPQHWELEDTPAPIIVWWVLWIVSEILRNATLRSQLHARTVPEITTLTDIELATGVLSIPLALLARDIVRRVSRDQADRYGGQAPLAAD
jgi:hypothetical protein